MHFITRFGAVSDTGIEPMTSQIEATLSQKAVQTRKVQLLDLNFPFGPQLSVSVWRNLKLKLNDVCVRCFKINVRCMMDELVLACIIKNHSYFSNLDLKSVISKWKWNLKLLTYTWFSFSSRFLHTDNRGPDGIFKSSSYSFLFCRTSLCKLTTMS